LINMSQFTSFEEENIILLALDSPDFFYRIAKFMKPEYFEEDAHQYIMNTYIEYYEKNDDVPNRDILKDIIFKELKGNDELVDPIIELLNKEIDPRNLKYVKGEIVKWARIKQMSMLYSEEVIEDVKNGDIEKINDIVEGAANISDVIISPFRFFEDIDQLFIEDERDYFTTGFSRLDENIHDGNGPARRETMIWVAPTGVGKCHTLESKIIEKSLSMIYELEFDNGEVRKIAGFRKVQTTSGEVMVCDITEEHNIVSIQFENDEGDICL